MIIYSEEKNAQQSVFIKRIVNEDGVVVNERCVSIPLYQMENDEFLYFVLYDDYMKPISKAYEYLNYELRESPLTSRSKAAFALRLLYCFLSLSGYKEDRLDDKSIKELLFFLRGINSNPAEYSMRTQRSANTVNGYLSVYRSYFGSQHIKCDALFKSHAVSTEHIVEGSYSSSVERKRYDNNVRTNKVNQDSVPKYIGPDEFKRLYKLAIDNKDKTAKLLMHLMYGYGLRLGECLGITMEDIQETHDNGTLVPVIYLRNRMTDKRFQFCKGLMHVVDERQYSSHDYQTSKWKIIITYGLYEELLEYIEETHANAIDKYPDNYSAGMADIVSVRNKPDSNHYVFLNRYGKVLSDQTWNNSLRKYFADADIQVDYDIRDNNLSHRFRHGFAMFHAKFSEHPVDALALAKMMRHKSLSSTMVYYNPTPEDELQIKTDFQEELYSMIPELKEGYTDGDN